MANSEDPDEMQHNAAFHQGLHCLLRKIQSSGTEIPNYLNISTCDPLKIYNEESRPYSMYRYEKVYQKTKG